MNASGLWRGHVNGRVGHFKFISVEVLPNKRRTRRKSSSSGKNDKSPSICSSSRSLQDQHFSTSSCYEDDDAWPDDVADNSRPKSVKDLLERIRLEVNSSSIVVRNRFFSLAPARVPQIQKHFKIILQRFYKRYHRVMLKDLQIVQSSNKLRFLTTVHFIAKFYSRILPNFSSLFFQKLIPVFVLNGFEELNTFREITERELDYLNVLDPDQRSKLMTAVELLQEYTSCKFDASLAMSTSTHIVLHFSFRFEQFR